VRFQALDGWRGIAALLVAVYHSPFYGHIYGVPLVRNAYLFVDLFFVLSGFVISHAYADRLGDGKSVLTFLIRRFGRLWPLHAFVLAAFVGIELLKFVGARHGLALHHTPFTDSHSLGAIFANLALVHSLGVYDHLTWNGPSWSISVEFGTYLAFAAVIALSARRSLVIAVAIVVATPLAVLALSHHTPVADVTYDYGALRCLFGFFLGYLTHHLFRAGFTGAAGPARPWLPWLTEASVVVAIVGFVSGAGDGVETVLAPLVFAIAIYVFAHESGPISRLLRTKWARRLGDWSYSIYMTHVLVITVGLELGRGFEKFAHIRLLQPVEGMGDEVVAPALPHAAIVADGLTLAYLAATVVLSALTFRFIEKPGREFFARLADRLSGATPTQAGMRWRPVRVAAERH
jgi:hypothetical protein